MTNPHSTGWSQPFTSRDLPRLRQALRQQAHRRGLSGDVLEDFVTAAHELMTNAVRHGGGSGVVRLRREGGTLICDVSDNGPGLTGEIPLGPQPRSAVLPGGRGLWLAHHLTDGLTVRGEAGGVVASVTVSVPGSGGDC